MLKLTPDSAPLGLIKATLLASCLGLVAIAPVTQDDTRPPSVEPTCNLDLTLTGSMSDIVSNALMLGLDRPESEVSTFLIQAKLQYPTGGELLRAAAEHFELSEAVLTAQVEEFRHCNCGHAGGGNERAALPEGSVEAYQFAKNVTTHVVLHEMGHALIREFDLPIFGNEETAADAFATYYLTTHLPERALEVLEARTASLMYEAQEVPREEWSVSGEHNNDARRAFQIAALAVAADSEKYGPMAMDMGMSNKDIRKAQDYGAEIRRSWRRILDPLWMPMGTLSNEARVKSDQDSAFVHQLCSGGFTQELESIIRQFDWHSQVTIYLAEGEGGAGWSRSKRTITVNSEYVQRFVKQGESLKD